MQATARRLSVVSATSCARRRLIRNVRASNEAHRRLSNLHTMLTTPVEITSDAYRLSQKIGGLKEPQFVPVVPRSDATELNDCFMDVERQIAEFGGSIQHGWIIWIWPGLIALGEFHAVWRAPSGDLLDVSPKEHGEKAILFCPDPIRVFNNERIDNVRVSVGSNPLIDEWISLAEQYSQIMASEMKGAPFGAVYRPQGKALEIRLRRDYLARSLASSMDAR